MKDELDYIDKFYKSKLGSFEDGTETNTWQKLKWALFWMRYKRILVISSIILLLGVSSIASYEIFYSDGQYDEYASESEINIVTISDKQDVLLQNNQNNSSSQLETETAAANEVVGINNGVSFIETAVINEGNVDVQLINENESLEYVQGYDNSNVDKVDVYVEDHMFDNTFLKLSEIPSMNPDFKLSNSGDTLLMGENRRDDIVPPGIKKQLISLSIYAGPAFTDPLISGSSSEYINYRNSNETNAIGWSVGSDLKFHLKNWIITTGINYTAVRQNRSYIKTLYEYSQENSYFLYDTSWVYIFDAPDYGVPMVDEIDSSWVKVYDELTIDNSGQNKLNYLEIPLLLGYRINSNLFAFEINAGMSTAFLISSDYYVPDMQQYDELIKVNDLNMTMFNFLANINVYYHLNRNTSLYISPYYKQNLNSVFQENYPYNQKFKTFGINFGVNIRF